MKGYKYMTDRIYQKEKELKLQELEELKKKWENEIEQLRQIREKYEIMLANLHEMDEIKKKMM